MKVYLLRAYAYKKSVENLCSIDNFQSLIFGDLKSAIFTGKQILKKQIKEMFNCADKSDYDSLEEFRESEVGYVFQIEETDPSKYNEYSYKDIEEYYVDDDNIERWCKEIEQEIKNPLYVTWDYDYNGNLLDRIHWSVNANSKNIAFERWKQYGGTGRSFRPNDEKEAAGKKFTIGDLVTSKKNKADKRIYFVTAVPIKRSRYFWNDYRCDYLSEELEYDGSAHSHFHEEDIELYTGNIPENLKWISQYLKEEIVISSEDIKNIGNFNFSDKPSYKTIKITKVEK